MTRNNPSLSDNTAGVSNGSGQTEHVHRELHEGGDGEGGRWAPQLAKTQLSDPAVLQEHQCGLHRPPLHAWQGSRPSRLSQRP